MGNYIKGNLLNVFYRTGNTSTGAWAALAYSTSNSLSMSTETTDISSKDHGLHPDKQVTGSSWSMSGEYYFTPENANKIISMKESGVPQYVCFCQVAQTDYSKGLKSVTGISDASTAWTPGTSFVKYGKALVTSCEISGGDGETATMSVEFTGSGALTDNFVA